MAFVLPPPKIRPFSLKNRRVVANYRVFDVLHHDVETASGKALPGVYTFGCRDWCNVIPVTPNDEVVLIWQFRFGSERMELEVPGGVIDANEDPAVAAVRELREETGFEAPAITSLGRASPNPAFHGNTCHFFLAEGARPTGATSFDEHEDIEIVLVPRAHIRELIDNGTIRHALAIIPLERWLTRT